MAKVRLRITLKKSLIRRKPDQVKTAQALGLRRIGRTTEKNATPQIVGMVNSISHMLEVEEIKK